MESKWIGNDTCAVNYLCLYLLKHHPQAFIAAAKDSGYPVIQKLTEVEAAVWADLLTNFSNAWCIVKHLEHVMGFHLSIPEAKFQKLGADILEPSY